LVNSSTTLVYARGNPCGTNYTSTANKCAGNLLALAGVTLNPTVIESSLHTGKQNKSFVSTTSGTPQANLVFDLGAAGAADAIVFWQFSGTNVNLEIRDYQVRTSNTIAANGQSLVNPVTVATGTLIKGSTSVAGSTAGQRINGLALQRYVQVVGLTNYGSLTSNALGAIGFVNAP